MVQGQCAPGGGRSDARGLGGRAQRPARVRRLTGPSPPNRWLGLASSGDAYRGARPARTVPPVAEAHDGSVARSAKRAPSHATVGLVVLASIVLTAFHFVDNAVYIDTYPAPGWQPTWFGWVVVASWFLFTGMGVAGFLLYRRGRPVAAHPYLFAYALAGLISLGHFLYGSPSELTTRGLISVLVDAVAGTAVLVVTVRSMLGRR